MKISLSEELRIDYAMEPYRLKLIFLAGAMVGILAQVAFPDLQAVTVAVVGGFALLTAYRAYCEFCALMEEMDESDD